MIVAPQLQVSVIAPMIVVFAGVLLLPMAEVLLSIKLAGADIILTYFAKQAARLLKGSKGGR